MSFVSTELVVNRVSRTILAIGRRISGVRWPSINNTKKKEHKSHAWSHRTRMKQTQRLSEVPFWFFGVLISHELIKTYWKENTVCNYLHFTYKGSGFHSLSWMFWEAPSTEYVFFSITFFVIFGRKSNPLALKFLTALNATTLFSSAARDQFQMALWNHDAVLADIHQKWTNNQKIHQATFAASHWNILKRTLELDCVAGLWCFWKGNKSMVGVVMATMCTFSGFFESLKLSDPKLECKWNEVACYARFAALEGQELICG